MLRIRLGDGFYMEAMRQLSGQPSRPVPAERQYHITKEKLLDEHGVWNDFRYWLTDRLSERGDLSVCASVFRSYVPTKFGS